MGEPDLVAEDLRLRYRRPPARPFARRNWHDALAGVSLRLGSGERLGVVGESGSGKSTLLRVLLALEEPDSGTVRYAGRDLRSGRAAALRWFRSQVQFVPQDPMSSLNPRLRVARIVAEPLVCLGVGGDHRSRVADVLAAVGLEPEMADRHPHEFSGGQRQRIAIARAIAPEPQVLLADEPVSSLDAAVRVQVLDLLESLSRAREMGLVMVSHDLGTVRRVCERVAVMHAGRVVEEGTTTEVFATPRHEYTRRLLAAVPHLPAA